MINKERLKKTFINLSAIDGTHGNEIKIANKLSQLLIELGFSVKIDKAGDSFGGNSGNIIGRLEGNIELTPIFLCAHMDTISSTEGIKHIVQDELIKTDGNTILGGDDRAGVAVILEIFNVLKENNYNHRPIEVLFTVCEESGMHGAKFVERSHLQSEYGFVFDCQADPGNYIISAPAAVSFKIIVKGVSAHAAVSPGSGVHAIQIASMAIVNLKLGRWGEAGMLNIGTICGGKSINVIPDEVTLSGEVRNTNNAELSVQINHVKEEFEKAAAKFGGKVEFSFNEKYGSYNFTGDEAVVTIVESAIKKTGLNPTPIVYPGGSDANVLNNKNITALNLGVGFKYAHSYQEFISVDNLVKTAEIGVNVILESSNKAL